MLIHDHKEAVRRIGGSIWGKGGRCPLFKLWPPSGPQWRPHKPTYAFICGDGWGGRPPALEVATILHNCKLCFRCPLDVCGCHVKKCRNEIYISSTPVI